MKKTNKFLAIVVAFSLIMATTCIFVGATQSTSEPDSTAQAGGMGVIEIAFNNVTGLEATNFNAPEDVTIKSVNAIGTDISCLTDPNGESIHIFAYDNSGESTTITLVIGYELSEDATGTYTLTFDYEVAGQDWTPDGDEMQTYTCLIKVSVETESESDTTTETESDTTTETESDITTETESDTTTETESDTTTETESDTTTETESETESESKPGYITGTESGEDDSSETDTDGVPGGDDEDDDGLWIIFLIIGIVILLGGGIGAFLFVKKMRTADTTPLVDYDIESDDDSTDSENANDESEEEGESANGSGKNTSKGKKGKKNPAGRGNRKTKHHKRRSRNRRMRKRKSSK